MKSQISVTLAFYDPAHLDELEKQEKNFESTKMLLIERVSNSIKTANEQIWDSLPNVCFQFISRN